MTNIKKILIGSVLAPLALATAACGGPTDHGGYPSAEQACASMGAKIDGGIVKEGDGSEANCTNGRQAEADKNHLINPSENLNPWVIEADVEADDAAASQGLGDDD